MTLDFILCDDTMAELATYFNTRGSGINDKLDAYLNCMYALRDEGILEGNVHDGLVTYIQYAEELKGQMVEISEMISSKLTEFVEDIDEIDQFIY